MKDYEKIMQDYIEGCTGLQEFTALNTLIGNLRSEFYNNVILNKDKHLWECCRDYLALLERLNETLSRSITITLYDMERQLTDQKEN